MMRTLVKKSKTAAKIMRTSAYYFGYKAITHPSTAHRFAKALSDTILDFDQPSTLQLPPVSLHQFCPGIETLELNMTVRFPKSYELPLYETFCISAIIHWLKPALAFEIGTHRGRTTQVIGEQTPTATRIYTLNLSPERIFEGQYVDGAYPHCIGEEFRSREIGSKITQLFGNSRTFDFSPFYGKADFIFIDGDHRYEGVASDTRNALLMVRPGGIILWDDYHAYEPGVVQCLNELRATKMVCHLEGTRFACYQSPGAK